MQSAGTNSPWCIVAYGEVEGYEFTLRNRADGLIWCFPDGRATGLSLAGHDMAKAHAMFEESCAKLLEQWKAEISTQLSRLAR